MEGIGNWLRDELIASWREIAAVLFLTTGYFIFSALWMVFYRFNGHSTDLLFSNSRLIHGTAVEGAILALFLGFLHWRGWTPSDFKIRIGWQSSLQGIQILIVLIVCFACFLWILFMVRGPHILHDLHVSSATHPKIHYMGIDWIVLIISQIVNAYFEELIFMGYAFNQFAIKRGPFFALVLTIFLRLLAHTWKPSAFLFETGIVFLIFGLFYWRTHRIWPLILAHTAYDIILIGVAILKSSF